MNRKIVSEHNKNKNEMVNKNDWNDVHTGTEHDGEYLCAVEIPQPCGNIWIRQMVISNSHNLWLSPDKVNVTHWRYLPPMPYEEYD